jgi:hypothetical protein
LKYLSTVLAFLFIATGVIAYVIIGLFLQGWALTHLWSWFISPLGVMNIGLWHAVGIMSVVSFMTYKPDNYKNKDKSELASALLVPLMAPLFAVLFGYLIHLAM